MDSEYITRSDTQTQKLAHTFAQYLTAGDVVFLHGDLGSGKTTFVKGVANALGVTERVISPTFTIVRTHYTNNPTIKTLYHLDLYRLEGSQQDTIGIQDMKDDSLSVMFVEWPEYVPVPLTSTWEITFQAIGETNRQIIFQHT